MHRPRNRQRRQCGFTLIESLVVVGIAGVLSSMAYPSLEGHLLRARRIDGVATLLQAQLAQERLRANRAAFGSLAEIGMRATSAAGHYALAANGDTEGYELVATALGAQARDAACRSLRLRSAGAGIEYASGPDAASSNAAAANRRCWNR